MKQMLFAAALVLVATGAQAQNYGTGSNPSTHTTSGYTRSNGTYVPPLRRHQSERDTAGQLWHHGQLQSKYRDLWNAHASLLSGRRSDREQREFAIATGILETAAGSSLLTRSNDGKS